MYFGKTTTTIIMMMMLTTLTTIATTFCYTFRKKAENRPEFGRKLSDSEENRQCTQKGTLFFVTNIDLLTEEIH